ncbi:MAG: TonB-dependent receptor [Planctomycetota bacterium]|jgi:hypothetical protein
MKQAMEWKIAAVIIICLVAFTSLARAEEADESGKKLKGEVRFRYDYFDVREDRGRFREDNWMTDGSTGGLDWLRLESTGPDEDGYEWIFEGRALYDYDYRMYLLMKKEDSHYLKLDFSSLRRYYDGSNEFVRLPLSEEVKRLVEVKDGDFFVDRQNFNIELGLTPLEGPQWIFGWHRLVKDGKEVLLRGQRGEAIGGSPRFQGIPTILDQRGITDTFYAEVYQTFADKYNFRIRQEYERFHDSQRSRLDSRFEDDGQITGSTSDRSIVDDLGYTNWRTMFMFDSFLDEETYITANYMYNYLNNDSKRHYSRNPNSPLYRKEVEAGRSRKTNVGAFGYRKYNVLQIPDLYFTAGLRIEDSKTSAQNWFLVNSDSVFDKNKSQLDEVRVGETLRLVYKGIERTTLSFDADLEQRHLSWKETYRTESSNQDYKADIDYTDQVYTLKAVHRHNRAVKSTVKFRIKDLERSYTNRFDDDIDSPPGWWGSYRRKGNDITLKTDWRLNSKTTTTLLYQFLQESIDFDLGGKTQNLEIHRGAGSLSFSPAENLFLVGSFMLENFTLDTPINATGSNHAPGPRPYDFSGNSYSLLLDGTYAFNDKTSATLGFRHTEAMGSEDHAGDYVYDTVGLTLRHKFAANQTVGLGYHFMNFNSHHGSSFDDYKAHGMTVTYAYTF